MRRGLVLALVLGLAAVAPIRGAGGAAAEPQFLILSPVGSFDNPTYTTSPPGDQDRLFVVEKGGVIKLVLDGVIQPTPFLDVTNLVDSGPIERGLLSMAFPPDYATSGLFYIDYTAQGTGAMTVDEFRRSASDPNVADPFSRRNVITVPHPTFSNHNGGQLQFGPDGLLYIGTGDGGGGGDPFRSAQNLLDLRGKILRIDPRQDGPNPYRIPPNNPFVGHANADPEIWSFGLRNPWRFSFDRAKGDLVIGDVGQDTWEEIDYRPVQLGAGRATNFGWSCYEGRVLYNSCPPLAASPVLPVFVYSHATGACSITGGYVDRDSQLTLLQGQYVYGDWCTGEIHAQTLAVPSSYGDTDTGLNVPELSSFGEDTCGRLYAVGVTNGGSQPNVFRLLQTDPPPPNCSPPALPLLMASVDDNFEIHLRDARGRELDGGTLRAGAYRVEVADNSRYHNFHLEGAVSCVPRSSCATDVTEVTHETWTVNFTPGLVEYQCDPHEQYMHGDFTVVGGSRARYARPRG